MNRHRKSTLFTPGVISGIDFRAPPSPGSNSISTTPLNGGLSSTITPTHSSSLNRSSNNNSNSNDTNNNNNAIPSIGGLVGLNKTTWTSSSSSSSWIPLDKLTREEKLKLLENLVAELKTDLEEDPTKVCHLFFFLSISLFTLYCLFLPLYFFPPSLYPFLFS